MKRCRPLLIGLLLTFSLLSGMTAAQEETGEQFPALVEVDVYYRNDRWLMPPPVADDPLAEDSSTTRSVYLAVNRAVNPQTGQPFDKSEPTLDFDLQDLRHWFHLEKREFLLGEPILVEHRIELNGAGQLDWFVGGNYRARGRDDNFTFVMQRADGHIVPDVYPKLEGPIFGGGLSSNQRVEKDKPLSYWLGLQRYSAITEPGIYDLYCLTGYKRRVFGEAEALRAALPEEVARDHYIDDRGVLIDQATGQQSERYQLKINPHYLETGAKWPLKGLVPPAVLAYASEQSFVFPHEDQGSFGTVAHFRIEIRRGTRAEQQRMVARWTKTADSLSGRRVMEHYNEALLESLWYAKQDHFLPLLESWIKTIKDPDGFDALPMHLDGLAMRADSAAFALILKATPAEAVNAFYSLHPDRIADAIPVCINWLTHANDRVRSVAESHLVRWTGQSFEHTWEGYDYQRPTLQEGQRMQQLWRAWWEKNKKGFKPRKPCPFPCRKTESEKDEAR